MKHTRYEDYVCAYCFHQLSECTCEFGNFMLIQIDENIQYAVRVLNEKGWITKYCCEGHFTEKLKGDVPYIGFEKHIQLPSCPEGWKIHNSNNLLSIECDCRSKSKVLQKQIEQFEAKKKEAINNLNKWVDGLGINEDY